MVSDRARNAGIKTFDQQEQHGGTEVSTSANGASITGDSTLAVGVNLVMHYVSRAVYAIIYFNLLIQQLSNLH